MLPISGDEAAKRLDMLRQQVQMAAEDDSASHQWVDTLRAELREVWSTVVPEAPLAPKSGALSEQERVEIAAHWDHLPSPIRQRLRARLELGEIAVASVRATPPDPKSPMYQGYAGRLAVFGLTGLLLLGLIGTALLVKLFLRDGATEVPDEGSVLMTVLFMGMLGGCLHASASLGVYVGDRKLERSWIVYYLLLPFQGAAMAVVVYFVFRMGLDLVLKSASVKGGGVGISELNLPAVYAFAGLAGLFSRQALEMLGGVFSTVFKPVQGSDKTSSSPSAHGDSKRAPGDVPRSRLVGRS